MLKKKKVVSMVLALALTVGTVTPCLAASGESNGKSQLASGESPYTSSSVSSWTDASVLTGAWSLDWAKAKINGGAATVTDGTVVLNAKSTLTFDVPITESGTYKIAVKFCPKDAMYMDCLLDMTVNGTDDIASLPLLWADRYSVYGTDRKGNELVPEQISVPQPYLDFLADYHDTNMDDLTYTWEAGTQTVAMTPESQDVVLYGIYVCKETTLPTYKEYMAANAGKADATDTKIIEAERYMVKSDSFIRASSQKDAALYPYDTYAKLLNILDGGTWRSAGQKILWEFEVDADGYYQLGLRYLQNSDTNKPVYRTVEIDGSVPFAEWKTVAFDNTRTNKFDNKVLDVDGEPAKVYLTAGKHTLAMEVTIGPLEEIYDGIIKLMEDINAFGMDIQKLTAGQTDVNRTWNMDYYMPNAVNDLLAFADRTDELYKKLEEISGANPSYADSLKYASETLRKLTKRPNQIPNKSDLISQGDNSATKYLGNVLSNLNTMPMAVDRFYVGNTEKLPSARSNIFRNTVESVKAFVWSFSADAAEGSYTATGANKSTELTVWINRSVPYVQVLQQIIDADYNSKYGTNIQLSIMPNEQKLVLANATKTNPDVVLSAGIGTPFNFAVRGAVKNLLEYDDFLSFYNQNYNLQALVPTTFNGGVYGATETQDFYVLFYRKDILKALNLSIPQTWDDVKYMMPTLLRYGMNFCIPLSINTSYKNFAMTNPFVTQNGASYVTADGSAAAFDNDPFLDAMTEMTELYEIYGMNSAVPSFYNSFRYGEIPMGVATFGTYIQLQMAAPELAGKWGIAMAPGTKQADGSILRYQPAAGTACMIFNNTTRSDEAWRFLKWWLSTDTQVKYAYMMQGTYGTEYRWNTGNLTAFSQMSYSQEDKETILKQWEQQKEITYHPANYMIERQTSDVWNGVVVDQESLVEEIDRATLVTNRELIRKLEEFGFCDKDGKMIRNYSMDAYADLQKKLAEVKAKEAGTN